MKSLQKQTFAGRIEQWQKGYLSPKDWEYDSGLRIYKIIGIRFFKKYLPTSGDIVRRWRHQTAVDVCHRDLNQQLYHAELQTRKYELRHILGALGSLIIACLVEKKLTVFDYFFLTILNVYVNIYPICLQRYNRIRIIKILQKKGLPSPFH